MMLETTTMKRPVGVTVIAVLNILATLALAAGELLRSAQRPQVGFVVMLAVVVLFSVGLSVALFMLQNWARRVTIVLCVLPLLNTPRQVVTAHGVVDAVTALLPGLFLLWAVWYLFQSDVEAAFGQA
jgi:hypothetical protein